MTLNEWLKERGMSISEFARRLNVERTSVHKWLNKTVSPNRKNFDKIKEITNGAISDKEI